jgi:hypothetical protein
MIVFMDTDGAAATSSTWNPADKGANVVLSNGNITAAKAGSGYESVRGVNGKSSGKRYFEVTVIDQTILLVGVADAGCTLTTRYIGENNAATKKSASWWSTGFRFANMTNAYSQLAVTGFGAGTIVGVGVDFATFTITFYLAATPTLVTTYVDSTPWPTLYPAMSMQTDGSGTLNALGPFTNLPSGFVAWDSP